MSIIDVYDLPQSIKDAIDADTLALIVAGLNAKAERVAPCLADDPSQGVIDEARLILLGAVKRWAEAGSGAFTQQTAGPFSASMDTRTRGSGYSLWSSEVEALQALCPDSTTTRSAFTLDTASSGTGVHQPWCSLYFGATYCSCGADLTGYQYPLYEGGALS